MKKRTKQILTAGGIAAVLLLAAVLCIPAFFDIRQYKPGIEKQVSDALARPVSLAGEMDVSVFPWIGFSAAEVSVDSPPDFAEKNFIRVKSCEVRVELFSLLSGNIRVRRIVLEEPRIILEKNRDGRGNWEGIGKKEEKIPGEKKDGDSAFAALAVGDLSIIRGTLVQIDQAAQTRKEFSDLNLKIRDLSFDHPIQISFGAKTDGHPLTVDGRIGPLGKDWGKNRIPVDISCKAEQIADLKLSGHVENLGESPAVDMAVDMPFLAPRRLADALKRPFPLAAAPDAFGTAAFKGIVKANAKQISLSEGKIALDQSHVDISFRAADFSGPEAMPVISLNLKADSIDLTRWLSPKKTAQTEPEKKAPKPDRGKTGEKTEKQHNESLINRCTADISLLIGNLKASFGNFQDVKFALSGKEGKYDLSLSLLKDQQPISLKTGAGPLKEGGFPFALSLRAFGQLKADLKGRVSSLSTRPEADLRVEISPFSPRKLIADLGIPFPLKTANPQICERAAFSGNVKGGTDAVSVSGGVLNLDQSTLQFSLQAKNPGSAPDIRFEGKLDSLDVNSWMPPSAPESAQGNKSADTKKAPDYTRLRTMSLEGKARIGKLRMAKTELSDLFLKISSKNGMFYLDPLTAGLYGGNLSVKGMADFRSGAPVSDISLNAEGIAVTPLLRDTVQKDFLEGKTKARVSVTMKGDRADQIRQSLNGDGTILFTDGAIRGIDLTAMARNIDQAFETGLLRGAEKSTGRTDFSEFETLFSVRSGVVNVSKTSLVSPFLRAEGQGSADLNRETLDFRINPKFVATVAAKGHSSPGKGVMVPVLVGGTFSNPSFQPDLPGMVQQMPEETVKEILNDPKKGISNAVEQILRPGKKKDKKEESGEEASGSPEKKIGDFLKKLPLGQ